MKLQKGDFVEIEFTGKIKDTGEIFDSNIQKDIEVAGLKTPAKPFIFPIGQGMFLQGIDNFIQEKEPGKTYHLELEAENAFGLRDSKLVQLMPLNIFRQHNLNPVPGAMFNFDGRIAKVLSVSGGRVRVDFNNPLAGKDLSYDINILRKVEDMTEKVKSVNEFLFKKDFEFEIKEDSLVMKVEEALTKFVELFKDKFKEIFNLELKVETIEKAALKE